MLGWTGSVDIIKKMELCVATEGRYRNGNVSSALESGTGFGIVAMQIHISSILSSRAQREEYSPERRKVEASSSTG
jgi:hypothetical protein